MPNNAPIKLVCRKCTRVLRMSSPSIQDGIVYAQSKGWMHDAQGPVCPKCPARRPMVTMAELSRLRVAEALLDETLQVGFKERLRAGHDEIVRNAMAAVRHTP